MNSLGAMSYTYRSQAPCVKKGGEKKDEEDNAGLDVVVCVCSFNGQYNTGSTDTTGWPSTGR